MVVAGQGVAQSPRSCPQYCAGLWLNPPVMKPQDMLIALYALPETDPADDNIRVGFVVRPPLAPEYEAVLRWIGEHFTPGWASEARVALGNRPATLMMAVDDGGNILGFCCHDAIARGFVGPVGVLDSARRRGVGAALLRASLAQMASQGYGYAVAGAVGAPEFFARVAGATPIEGSWPGVYRGMLRS